MDEPAGIVLSGRYLTVEEFAEWDGISPATARRYAARREGHESIKVGKQWLIRIGKS